MRAARVLGRHVEAGYETLVVSVDAGACADPWNRGWQVRLDGAAGEPQPWSGVATQVRPDPAPATARSLTLVVRRVAAPPDAPAKKDPALLHVYAPAGCGSSTESATGQHLRFTLPETSGLPDDPQALSTYLIELGQKLRFGSPFGAFAQARVHALAEERFKATAPSPPARLSRQILRKLGVVGFGHRDVGTAPARPTPSAPRRTPADLARLMSTTADATSLQAMLQQDRRLAAFTADEAAPIPIDKLAGPTLVARPWRELARRARAAGAGRAAGRRHARRLLLRSVRGAAAALSPARWSRRLAVARDRAGRQRRPPARASPMPRRSIARSRRAT